MTAGEYREDLVVLTADKDMEFTLRGALGRPEALGIKQIRFEIYRHPQRDPGCFVKGHDFLRPFVKKFHHALIIHDREGCGKQEASRVELEREIEERLSVSGWGDRAAAIVIDPELENWIWSNSPEVDRALGWQEKTPPLRDWLEGRGYFDEDRLKPDPPKRALKEALRNVRKPLSSSIFIQVARTVSLKRCSDPAFLKLREKLAQWFAPAPV